MPRAFYDVRTEFGGWVDGLRKPKDWQWWNSDAKARWVLGKRREWARRVIRRDMRQSEKERKIRDLLAKLEVLIRGV